MIRDLRTRLWNQPHGLAYVRCSKDEQEGSTEGQLRLIQSEMQDRSLTLLVPAFVDRRPTRERRGASEASGRSPTR